MKTPQLLWAATILVVLVLAATLATHGQNQPVNLGADLAPLDLRVKQFFADVGNGNAEGAFDDLLLDSQLRLQAQAVLKLRETTKELESKYGDFRNAELVGFERLGTDVVLFRYLFHCEHFPVVWYVTFYRVPDEMPLVPDQWAVISIRFDTDLELLAISQ